MSRWSITHPNMPDLLEYADYLRDQAKYVPSRPTKSPKGLYDLQDAADRGQWYCLGCAGALMFSALTRLWSHYNPEIRNHRPIPSHQPSDASVEAGRWP